MSLIGERKARFIISSIPIGAFTDLPGKFFLASWSQGVQSPVLKDLQFSLNYHAFACSNMTRQWLLSEPHVTPEEQNYRTLRAMPQMLHDELNCYREKEQV